MKRNWKKLLGISLSLVLVFMTLGLTASATGPTIFDYTGSDAVTKVGVAPVGNNPDLDTNYGGTIPSDSLWYKWDGIEENTGNQIKSGTSFRFTLSPAPNCDSENLFVYAKAGNYIGGGFIDTVGGSVYALNFNIYFESIDIVNNSWTFVVTGNQAPNGLSNWGFLCKGKVPPESVPVYVQKEVVDSEGTVIDTDTNTFYVNITDGDYVQTKSFDIDNPAKFNLLPGKYEISEAYDADYEFAGMSGVDFDIIDDVWYFTVTDQDESITIKITNEIPKTKTVTLIVYKAFADDNGNDAENFKVTLTPIEESEISLFILNNSPATLEGNVSVDEELKFTDEDGLSMYTRYIIEEDPNDCELIDIDGTGVTYNPQEERWEVWIDGEGTYSFTIVNKCDAPKGKLIVQKVINGGGSASQLFGITVTPDEGDAVTGQVSVNTQAEFNLAPGWYTISENTPLPTNYTLVGYNPANARVEVVENRPVTVIITNNYSTGGGGGGTTTTTTTTTFTPPPVTPPVVVEVTPEPAAVQPEVVEEIELEPELPATSGADILLLGLGVAIAGGGLLIRRKRK
ncbi:MAG: LPXTG cell wall anchor domain-containing protein [Clostridiales bacterium]|nr:LPXTG cell wall anchor domain-containing protein [Clostridiales bacterium]